MTAPTIELQAAIVAAVEADTALMSLVTGIYDRVHADCWGSEQGFISFGSEDDDIESGCIDLQRVSLPLHVWSRRTGRVHCKQILHELRRVMRGLTTAENPIVAMAYQTGKINQDPDGLTTHGLLRYEITMEAHG